MLKIQRASAGSGKTYELAKQFILNLLAYKSEKGNWYLRNERQIEDALSHILAITFTNKATNEMKSRIVTNLSLLSRAVKVKINPELIKSTPYLEDFHKITGAPYNKIGETAEKALRVILNHYSYFKVSTIDSFFQEILRTFVYEANINDSYQLEIDSSFVADAALESAMQELDSRPYNMGNAAFWLKTVMNLEAKKSQKWNLFNKKATSDSIYANIKKALAQLESENFKDIKERLDSYFSYPANIDNLPKIYEKLRKKGLEEREKLLADIISWLDKVETHLAENTYPDGHLNKGFRPQLAKIRGISVYGKVPVSFSSFLKKETVFNKDFKVKGHPLDEAAINMYRLLETWDSAARNPFYIYWRIYGEFLPYLGLILEVRKFISEILEDNNIIQLSDTSFILKKIIGEDDAPFVYERIGNRIDHYLIDEFQDTSSMQWDIIRPLLTEGVAKNQESLIIGDPKQSIYRFRNADHRLITEVVPDTFPGYKRAGFTKEENTNWRSHTNIVKFNNYFFKTLAECMVELSEFRDGNGYDFTDLYANVVQYPKNQKEKGYVEIRRFQKPDDEDSIDFEEDNDDDNVKGDNWFDKISTKNIGPLIRSLKEKGYRYKDIAILVATNEKGKSAVKAIIDYNESLPDESSKIDFISEESLLVSSSPAVGVIIGVIEKLSQPKLSLPESTEETDEETQEKVTKRPYVKWNEIKTRYQIFSKLHSGMLPVERILKFLDEPIFEDSMAELLSDLPTPSLTSLVEAAIKTFLDDELKVSDALYLSSFQDIVTDYSVSHHNDPASFLDWWKKRARKLSVTSPEGIDAVQIMTIHKAKGLEFKCVIVPFATDSFTPYWKKEEWRWVEPENLKEIELPPVLPIRTSKALIGSKHEVHYREFFDQTVTDKLNMYYVAFTRAKNELYIFTPESDAKTLTKISDFFLPILSGDRLPASFLEEEEAYVMNIDDVRIDEIAGVIAFGSPLTPDEIKAEIEEERHKAVDISQKTTKYFNNYFVNSRRPRIRASASTMKPSGEL